jgi:IS5 family transposase
MINYTPSNQLTLEGFKHPFYKQLKPNNRWIKLAEVIPWDELAGIYSRNLDPGAGRLSVDIRMVIGALIIKHKQKLSDRDTVDMISENVYMQYFCGLKGFQSDPPFDASLFVDIRKRMGADKFDEFNETVIRRAESLKPKRKRIIKDETPDHDDISDNARGQGEDAKENVDLPSNKEIPNQGKLKLDASVADQYITYPTDLKLLNTAREETERLIDVLYKKGSFDKKPRTYRRKARKEHLVVSKKRRKSKKELRVIIGKQLRYVRRNISSINKMLDELEPIHREFPMEHRDQKIYWVIQHLFDQQMYMYRSKVHKCSDRIVNIYQPYVRPIVRGKDGADVEFGAKINISEVDGFVRCNHIGWDNYDEGHDLQKQVEDFKQLYGCYPELLLGDRKYLTRENRNYLKSMGIRIVGKPLGRPPKQKLTGYQKYKTRKEQNMRNHVEGKFGQGKNGYNLDQIRAKRKDTSESWISAILFIMNLTKLMKVTVEYGYFLAFSVIKRLRTVFLPVVVYDWIPVENRRAISV